MLGDILNADGRIREWDQRRHMELPDMARSAYKKLTASIDLERSRVNQAQGNKKIYMSNGTGGERHTTWEWELPQCDVRKV